MKTMRRNRRKFSPQFKAEVAIEALKERETIAELAQRYELHANQISQWKKEFLENSTSVFEQKGARNETPSVDTDLLYGKIGRLEMENEFLKKNLKKLGKL